MVIGKGYEDRALTENEIRGFMSQALGEVELTGKRVLIIIPRWHANCPYSSNVPPLL